LDRLPSNAERDSVAGQQWLVKSENLSAGCSGIVIYLD